MFLYLDIFKMKWMNYRSDLYNLQTRIKTFKRVGSGCKWSFCQCKKQQELQIWLLPRFPVMSEKCTIYRWLEHQKMLKTIKGYN